MKKIAILFFVVFSISLLYSCGQRYQGNDEVKYGTLIVASKSGDDLYFIDRADGEVLLILPTGLEPHEVEVSDDGRIAVVSNYGDRESSGNTLSVYDVQEGVLLKTIDLGEHSRPHGMVWMNGTDKLLVTAEGSRNLLVIDVEHGVVKQALYTGEDVSHMVAATSCFTRAFVPSIRTGNVAVFDLETNELLGHVYSGEGAEGIAMHPGGEEVWVTNRAENTITVLDAWSLETLASIPCADFPIRAKFTPDGSLFVVSNARSGDIAVFDWETRQQVASIELTPPVPEGVDETRYFSEFEGTSIPIGLVVPDNRWAYVANTRSDAVSIIDLKNMRIEGHFAAGQEPDGIHFSPLRPK